MSKINTERYSGILLHPTSLPSPYGIGDLGPAAHSFINFLKKAGQHLWQVLPLTPTGFGDSPYQSFSAFAGQPLLISPEHLCELGYLTEADLLTCPVGREDHVDYGNIIPWKNVILRLAHARFLKKATPNTRAEFNAFVKKNSYWLFDYALYMALKDKNDGKSWLSWEEEHRNPTAKVKKQLASLLEKEMHYYYFLQFIFDIEWKSLKADATENDIKIIGDIPLFVSFDSADVWANQKLFQLDSKGYPTAVAGVPPDYFCEEGQLWGNPLYDWKAHKKTNYRWWISRIKHQLQMADLLRIDHFRGLESYWSVPAGDETAIGGTWMPGPREDLFRAIQKALGKDLPIIAEDLGIITPEVDALRDAFAFPGMRILQFAFDSEEESAYHPHQFDTSNCVCYTGTHDNNTTQGWYHAASEEAKDKVRYYMNTDGNCIHWDFIRTCLGTIAKYAIFPMQDVLGIDADGRMNTPGSDKGNWSWRCKKDAFSDDLAKALANITNVYGR